MGAIKMKLFDRIMGLCFSQTSFSAGVHADHQFGNATPAREIGEPRLIKSSCDGGPTFLLG
jgi:hypothetical protein